MTDELLRVDRLVKHFPVRGGALNRVVNQVKAVNGVSFDVKRGEVLGLVGESGSGKTTVGRLVLSLEEATSGNVFFDGTNITALSKKEMRRFRTRMQIIFQDPYASLNPRERVRTVIGHALALHDIGPPESHPDRAVQLMEQVGLSAAQLDRFPHEFSGGQRQRIGIARALAVNPDFIVADEPVSALDVSVQAQVINLLSDLKDELNLTMLFIAHDLAVVEHVCDRVAVMYAGRIVEMGPVREIFDNPAHPYTQALIGSVPKMVSTSERLSTIEGQPPSLSDLPDGCRFAERCALADDRCRSEYPKVYDISNSHTASCWKATPG